MKNEIKIVAVILTLFIVSTYIYSTTLPAYEMKIDDLVHVETNKQSYRLGDTVKVTVYLSNPYLRPVKYPYFTRYGLDANYNGEFNEAILGSINISPASNRGKLDPFGREYLIRKRSFTVHKTGEFYITFKMGGKSNVTLTKMVTVTE